MSWLWHQIYQSFPSIELYLEIILFRIIVTKSGCSKALTEYILYYYSEAASCKLVSGSLFVYCEMLAEENYISNATVSYMATRAGESLLIVENMLVRNYSPGRSHLNVKFHCFWLLPKKTVFRRAISYKVKKRFLVKSLFSC